MVRLLSRTLPRSIEMRIELARRASLVLGDPGQLQQVFLNLAVNARDAMPDGRRAARSAASSPRGAARRRSSRCSVCDTGTGIAAELQERIFEPFFTTKQSEKGTGMGLAVVYGIVQSHRGAIALESAPGAGSALRDPPAALERGAWRRARAAAAREPVPGRGRVLVVDDEPAVRRVATRMLRRLGYEPDEADGRREALARLESEPGAYAARAPRSRHARHGRPRLPARAARLRARSSRW